MHKFVYNAIDRCAVSTTYEKKRSAQCRQSKYKQTDVFRFLKFLIFRQLIFFFFWTKMHVDPAPHTNLHRHQWSCHCNYKYLHVQIQCTCVILYTIVIDIRLHKAQTIIHSNFIAICASVFRDNLGLKVTANDILVKKKKLQVHIYYLYKEYKIIILSI